MIQTVKKRSGEQEPFEAAKTEKSVSEAARDAGVSEEEKAQAVSAVLAAVQEQAGDRTEVTTEEIRQWALETLDRVSPASAQAWRDYDAKQGK